MAAALKGVAFITGGASGIGKATAISLLRHGCTRLAIADLNLSAAEQTATSLKASFSSSSSSLEILPVPLDVSSESSITSAIESTVKAFGRIDYAINNAGIGGPHKPSHEHEFSDWRKTLAVDLDGVWLSSRAAIRQMLTQEPLNPGSVRSPRGAIVNVASMYGLIGTPAHLPVVSYVAAKHGVVGLTRADAIAYADRGIRINAICPGYVKTPLLEESMKTQGGALLQAEVDRTPVKRMAEMEEIGDAIAFLVGESASFMQGATLTVDGGFTIV